MLDENISKRVKDALFAQKYNLLLGSGVSLDSQDKNGKPLLGTEDLRKSLCVLTNAKESSPLWRVTGLLNKSQIAKHITAQYLGCKAGPTVKAITHFAWRTAYTLNIDDALEDAYEECPTRLQKVIPVNYNKDYETYRNPQDLPLIHLHGSSRFPDDGYVFSINEYAGIQRGLNPWVHSLSGLIISEPFIIAGTSLFEPDLEFFLAHRPSNANILSRAPSILVEPYPDAGTRKDCERLNLILVESTLHEFLEWMDASFGPSPTPLSLREPQHKPRTIGAISSHSSVAFWSDFEFIHTGDSNDSSNGTPSAFMFGRAPTWEDISNRLDIPLKSQLEMIDEIRRWQSTNDENQFICLSGLAGSGKSTTIRRISIEISTHQMQSFYLKSTGGFDAESAIEFLLTVADPIMLVTDSLAEHGEQLLSVFKRLSPLKRICVFGAERKYRMKFISDVFENEKIKIFESKKWYSEEIEELIKRYVSAGIIGNADAISAPRKLALDLMNNTTAEAVCRILNDFRPLSLIARSLWNDTVKAGRTAYLMVAISYYCTSCGVRSDIISSAYESELIRDLTWNDAPLRIVENPDDDNYLIPGSAVLSTLLVHEMVRERSLFLLDIAADLANLLSPFVTRNTIKQRTAEARLAGRLFDADGVLADLLRGEMIVFYEKTYDRWKWNSRYWEQRALFISTSDRSLAVRHARHAVSIERHPFPMTTLAKILFSSSTDSDPPRSDQFNEAFSLMEDALRIESKCDREKTTKAYHAILEGTWNYINNGGGISHQQKKSIRKVIAETKFYFPNNEYTYSLAENIDKHLGEI